MQNPAQRHDKSRTQASRFQFWAFAAGAMAGGYLTYTVAYDLMVAAFSQIGKALV